ncbi:hypothetical protein Bca52824_065769 [Brassica carinata]|uniref:Uncharacterized protein n=1 Tax=Brassica carinata TaxID=52824 RepID=A0A8X7UAB6_BRACI|nr:hypothetical protein Bca52824_065769 [Brassica carinata]
MEVVWLVGWVSRRFMVVPHRVVPRIPSCLFGLVNRMVFNGFVLAEPDVPALVSITDFLLVWPGLFHVLGLSSYPFQCRYARSWFKSASQWFRPSVLLLRGGGHSSVGRWLRLGCEGPRVRIGGLGRRFPESGGVLGVHSPLCSSVVLLELLSFSSVGNVQMA